MKRSVTTSIHLVEEFHSYNVSDYESWRSGPRKVEKMLRVSGSLGRSPSTYLNQARQGQNFPEVSYAGHLVGLGFPAESIVYENYTLSWREVRRLRGKSGLRAKGAALLSERFTEEFFRRIDLLYQRNRTSFQSPPKSLARLALDLCAIDPTRKRVLFVELKKYKPTRGTTKTEPLAAHQKLALAFLRDTLDTLGAACFQSPGWVAEAKLVSLVPSGCQLMPQTHAVEFKTA